MEPPLKAKAIVEPQKSTSPTTSRKLVVQDATSADAEAISRIGAATFTASFGYSMPKEHVQAYLEEAYTPTAISKDLADQQNHFLVARQESTLDAGVSEVVGFLQLKIGTKEPCLPPGLSTCEINRIYVSQDHLGGGVGQLLMERALRWARSHLLGSSRLHQTVDGEVDGGTKERQTGVWLGVWEENVKAHRFYRRWGFEKIGSHDFTMGGTTQTDFVMLKYL